MWLAAPCVPPVCTSICTLSLSLSPQSLQDCVCNAKKKRIVHTARVHFSEERERGDYKYAVCTQCHGARYMAECARRGRASERASERATNIATPICSRLELMTSL